MTRTLRWLVLAGFAAVLLVPAVACGGGGEKKATPTAPQQAASPAGTQAGAATPAAGTTPSAGAGGQLWAKPPIGSSWAEYFGVELEATLDASGPRLFDPKAGRLYFYTNAGTGWGATNTMNTVEIFDATDMKAWKPVAVVNLPEEYAAGYSSHGGTVSSDGRWIYLQAMGHPTKPSRLIIIDGFTLKPYKIYKSAPGARGHHVNNFTGPDGREYIMNVDFNWNFTGNGAWVIDPAKDHAIVGGMNRQDFTGNPYVLTGDVQKKFMYATMPAAQSKYRGKIEGMLAKIDMTTWKVLDSVPVLDPIWAEITQDGKTAWVTEGDGQKVKKIDLEKMTVTAEVSTGPGPWGARLSCDETKLYVADKGESAGYSQMGRTMTIIDTKFNVVTNVVIIGRTTDHVILSPDCKYVIANSNADHGLWVYDAETEELVTIVKMTTDGDPHGGTFVQFKDGQGGVVGEVVSTLTGLRGSALKAQQDLITKMKGAITVRATPSRSGTAGLFSPDTVKIKPGASVTLVFIHPAGTGFPKVAVESKDAKIDRFELQPGQRKIIDFKAPATPGKLVVSIPGDSAAKTLTLSIEDSADAYPISTPAAQATAAGPREIKFTGDGLKWSIDKLELKAGEKVVFVQTNNDDEKHNLINADPGLLMPPESPDVNPGQTTTFQWTVPNRPGTYKFFCNYHTAMVISVTIK